MNTCVRFLTAIAAAGALLGGPVAMATSHHHHAKTHHVTSHKPSGKAMAKGHRKSAAHPLSAQQRKMAQCAHESKGMKGAAHRAFMSKCLKKS